MTTADTISKIFVSIKNGTILKELHLYDNESLKYFLPIFVLPSLTSSFNSSTEMDILRTRLVEISSGNQFIRLSRLDFKAIEARCREIWRSPNAFQPSTSFVHMEPTEKVLTLCAQLIARMQRQQSSSEQAESFEAFDIEHCHDEVVWILTLASYYMPTLLNLVKFSRYLLFYQSGPRLLYLLILNQPDMFDAQIEELLSINCGNENGFYAKQRKNAILNLFELEPEHAERYITAMLETDTQMALAVKILSQDVFGAQFFVDTLIAHFINRNDLLTLFLTRTSRIALRKICERVGRIVASIGNENGNSELQERLILLIALLGSYSTVRLNNEEIHQWIHFLTHQASTRCNALKLTLATILASPTLTPNQQAFRDEVVEGYLIDYFGRLRAFASTANTAEYASLSQLMLLVAIHMNTNKGDELAALLSSVLGFKVGDTLRKLTTVRTLYLRHAVTDRDVAEKAAKIGVTRALNAKSSGYLSVHCIDHLLASRIFSKYQIPIGEWVKCQLRECTAPVHPIMTNLLLNFAISCVPTVDHEQFNRAIDEQFFWEVFSTELFDNRAVVVQLLSLFFLVTYTYKLETASQLPRALVGTGRAPAVYSTRLWAQIPIRYLLTIMDVRHDDFAATFRPLLLRFIGATVPHLLPTMSGVLCQVDTQISYIGNFCNSGGKSGSAIATQQFRDALERMHDANCDTASDASAPFLRLLTRVDLAPIQEQYAHYDTIVTAMERTLRADTPRAVIEKVVNVWQRLENLVPRRLYENTLQLWLNTDRAAISGATGSRSQPTVQVDNELLLAETPLILFRVDDRVFRSPPHFRCLMHMLSFYLEASRNANNLRVLKVTSATNTSVTAKAEAEEKTQLLKSYIGTQYLAVVKILLELCDGDAEREPDLAEIRRIACAQIHQMFIADSMLPKLVHFNMYPIHLIPIMVRGVPSAHVLIGFLGDLLVGANLERRIFGVILMAELIEQYKIPMAFAGVGLISDVLDTLMACTINEELIVLFLNVIPALQRLVRVSPFHARHFVDTMDRMRQVALARLAIYSSIISARQSPERRLLDALDSALRNLKASAEIDGLLRTPVGRTDLDERTCALDL